MTRHSVGPTVDLFCGCGGLTTGLVQAGFDVQLGIEYVPEIAETYSNNQDHEAVVQDISDVDATVRLINERVPGCVCVAGSPPCTDFSRAGLQVEGERASLTVKFAEIVTRIRPNLFIAENVTDMTSSSTWTQASEVLVNSGYSFVTMVIDAKYVGCPQARRRCIVVGCRTEFHADGALADMAAEVLRHTRVTKPMTIREYFGKLNVACPDHLYFPYRNKFQACVVSANDTYPTLRAHEGNCLRGIPGTIGNYKRRPNDSADISEAHALTVQQAAIISTFPLKYSWPDDRRMTGIMLGNCVLPLMAEWVGKLVIRHLAASLLLTRTPLPSRLVAAGTWINRPPPIKQWHRSHMETLCSAARDAGLTLDSAGIRIKPRIGSDGVAHDARELFYTYGTNDAVDAAVAKTLHTPLKVGYEVKILERMVQRSRKDDVFVIVPGHPVPYRGKSMLERNGLLP
jgi:DNA (cytosine-5)-methyltransferase 1